MSERHTEQRGGEWSVELDPPILLPSRPVRVHVRLVSDRDREARGVVASLVCEETYRYDRTERAGNTTRTVTHTDHDELSRTEIQLGGPLSLRAGKVLDWNFEVNAPDLGPASFEGTELRCDWTLEVKADLPRALDASIRLPVHVGQPVALLRAGVLDLGQYALFEEAPVNTDALPAQLRLEPVPICLGEPFSGRLSLETAAPVDVQEVRLELRVRAEVSVMGGRREEITFDVGRLAGNEAAFGGAFQQHEFSAVLERGWLPSVDLPHGSARARFHVILARARRPDVHYVRDVAISTTSDL